MQRPETPRESPPVLVTLALTPFEPSLRARAREARKCPIVIPPDRRGPSSLPTASRPETTPARVPSQTCKVPRRSHAHAPPPAPPSARSRGTRPPLPHTEFGGILVCIQANTGSLHTLVGRVNVDPSRRFFRALRLAMRARERGALRPNRVPVTEARSPPGRSACFPHPVRRKSRGRSVAAQEAPSEIMFGKPSFQRPPSSHSAGLS